MKYTIFYNGGDIGQVSAPSLSAAESHAREVFGEDVYCKPENEHNLEVTEN